MKTGLIILGIVLAVLILIEAFRQPKKAIKQVEKPVIQLTFKEMKDGNFKAVKRLYPFEIVCYKGSDWCINEGVCFMELYFSIEIKGKKYSSLARGKDVYIKDLESFINIIA